MNDAVLKLYRALEDASQHILSLPNDTALKELTSCKICFKLHFTNVAFTNNNMFSSSGQNALTAVHSITGRREQRLCIYFYGMACIC